MFLLELVATGLNGKRIRCDALRAMFKIFTFAYSF